MGSDLKRMTKPKKPRKRRKDWRPDKRRFENGQRRPIRMKDNPDDDGHVPSSVTLPYGMWKVLKNYAVELGCSRSALIRRIIRYNLTASMEKARAEIEEWNDHYRYSEERARMAQIDRLEEKLKEKARARNYGVLPGDMEEHLARARRLGMPPAPLAKDTVEKFQDGDTDERRQLWRTALGDEFDDLY